MDHHFYMDLAIEEAKKAAEQGEVPVGALVVCEGEILAQAHNLKEQMHDPTAHAEILVLQAAAKKLNRWRLTDCILYVTLEPCPMCAGAMVQARLGQLVYGLADSKSGAVESVVNLVQNKELNHQVKVLAGYREMEIRELMREFFQTRRQPGDADQIT
ncbi:MAG: tRNA adenosine(34) deaminase TadA [Bacillota bacterium]